MLWGVISKVVAEIQAPARSSSCKPSAAPGPVICANKAALLLSKLDVPTSFILEDPAAATLAVTNLSMCCRRGEVPSVENMVCLPGGPLTGKRALPIDERRSVQLRELPSRPGRVCPRDIDQEKIIRAVDDKAGQS